MYFYEVEAVFWFAFLNYLENSAAYTYTIFCKWKCEHVSSIYILYSTKI